MSVALAKEMGFFRVGSKNSSCSLQTIQEAAHMLQWAGEISPPEAKPTGLLAPQLINAWMKEQHLHRDAFRTAWMKELRRFRRAYKIKMLEEKNREYGELLRALNPHIKFDSDDRPQ